ncbi:MAG: acetylglutamate kinase [Opitutales bacterium]|nr:acetylglutamate kinase [Opitutales bacterium]MBP3358077.1 acetylglutamate kinase [Opitutales bacterium]
MDNANIEEITKKAGILVEALPYIKRFRGSVFVVKYGGAFMDDPNPQVRASVAHDIAFLATVGINVVIVHGGGKAISRAMTRAGLEPVFKNGMRVTDEKTVSIVEDVLNNEVNAEIADMLKSHDCEPCRIKGNDVLKCEKLLSKDENGEDVDIGYVGKVNEVDVDPILKAIEQGLTPVISPIAIGADAHAYNTNADVAASAVASALKARRLVFLCDVPGLMRDPKDHSTLISHLKLNEVEPLKKSGVIGGGMMPKVDSGVDALNKGVRRVHFIDGYMPHSLLLEIFTDKGIGTEIVSPEL